MGEYIKDLNRIYEEYERVLKEIAEMRQTAKEMKNEMIEIMTENGVDTAVVSGLEEEAVELVIEVQDREVINKKDLATQIGLKTKDLMKIEQWVALVTEGKVTSELIEQFKFTEESEKFSTRPYQQTNDES